MTPVMEGFYNSRHSDSDTHFVMTRCAVTALRFVAPAYCQVTGANRARVCGPGDYAVVLSLLLQQTVVITTLRFVSCPLQQKVYNHDTLWCLHCIPQSYTAAQTTANLSTHSISVHFPGDMTPTTSEPATEKATDPRSNLIGCQCQVCIQCHRVCPARPFGAAAFLPSASSGFVNIQNLTFWLTRSFLFSFFVVMLYCRIYSF